MDLNVWSNLGLPYCMQSYHNMVLIPATGYMEARSLESRLHVYMFWFVVTDVLYFYFAGIIAYTHIKMQEIEAQKKEAAKQAANLSSVQVGAKNGSLEIVVEPSKETESKTPDA